MATALVRMKTFPSGCKITKPKSYHMFRDESDMMKKLQAKFELGEVSFSMSAQGSYAMWWGIGNRREYVGRVVILDPKKKEGSDEKAM